VLLGGALAGVAIGQQGQPQTIFCHVPPGNVGNGQTISIPPPAVDAHLRNHPFDHTGPCTGTEATPATSSDLGPLFFGEGGFLVSEGFTTERFVDASGGDAGSARGGDGGRGGDGTLPICNQNSNDVIWYEYWDENGNWVSEEPSVNCAAGGRGGEAGDAGISEAGDGGIAFDIGDFF
jgi:hypothetical protein